MGPRSAHSWKRTANLVGALAAIGILATACGGSRTAGPSATSGKSTSASASPSPVVSLGEVPQGHKATPTELAAMISAGKKPAEAYLHLGDSDSCAPQQSCLFTDDAYGVVGINAGWFHGGEGCPAGCGGAGCWIYLFQDASAWHFVNAACAQAPGDVPGAQDTVRVSGGGCANVRDAPGTKSRVTGCVPDHTTVDVDSAPVYTDGKIWWHLQGKGWMAHDFLIAPPNH
jgi:hypothetical protein